MPTGCKGQKRVIRTFLSLLTHCTIGLNNLEHLTFQFLYRLDNKTLSIFKLLSFGYYLILIYNRLWKNKRIPGKHLLLLYWLCQSLWKYKSQQTVENSSRMGIPNHLTCLLDICMQVKKQQLDMKQQTSYKLGKEHVKAVYCHPAYLTSM